MAFVKGKSGNPKGRQAGARNNLTKSVKEAFEQAFNNMQKEPGACLADWGKENLTEFYKLAARLIPADINTVVTMQESAIELLAEGARRKAAALSGLPNLRSGLPEDQDEERLH